MGADWVRSRLKTEAPVPVLWNVTTHHDMLMYGNAATGVNGELDGRLSKNWSRAPQECALDVACAICPRFS